MKLIDKGGYTEIVIEGAKPKQTKNKHLYQPANGTEGLIFIEKWCDHCTKDAVCEILPRTMLYDRDDDEYPEEWTYDKDGKPQCTAFEKEE